MLFKSFIISLWTYCLLILYTSVCAKDKRDLRKIFNDGGSFGLFNIDTLDNLMDKRAKTLILNIIHDDNHIINDFLHKLPSGRYRSMKYWTALGKDSFVRHSILTLQKIF